MAPAEASPKKGETAATGAVKSKLSKVTKTKRVKKVNLKPGIVRYGREKRKIIKKLTTNKFKRRNRKLKRIIAGSNAWKARVLKKAGTDVKEGKEAEKKEGEEAEKKEGKETEKKEMTVAEKKEMKETEKKEMKETDKKETKEGEKVEGKEGKKKEKSKVQKSIAYYPVENKKKRFSKTKKVKKVALKKSLTPGTICIILAGPHKGKRVIFLKQLVSGLCLVTGPFVVNRCPLRRINQIYLIGTRTKVNLRPVKIPLHINDKYFKRTKLNKGKAKKDDATDIFHTKTKKYIPTMKRIIDQRTVDRQVLRMIRRQKQSHMLRKYMSKKFFLKNRDLPHQLKF